MNITVFCGANPGNDPEYSSCAKELGRLIAESGHTLVYGASNAGLMADIAGACLDAGGKITGVVPDIPYIKKLAHPELTRRIDTKDLSERKKVMRELGDAYIALPGGMGTLDEITEAMEEIKLETAVKKPVIFMNTGGFYNALSGQLQRMKSDGFVSKEDTANICFALTAEKALAFIEDQNK